MKVQLEDPEIQHRGILVTSENEEEKQVLKNIWCQKGRPASFGRVGDSVSITIAPTPEEEKE